MADKSLVGGLVLGLSLGVGGLLAVQHFVLAGPPCGAACGLGTVCEGDVCVVQAPEAPAEAEPEPDEEGKGKKRKRGRRGKRGGGSGEAGESELATGGPPVDNDAHVPRFDPDADQTISMSDGSGRLSDSQVDRELAKLDKDFQRCVLDANKRVAELGTGRVSMKFGVDGKGKVTGVNVSAPSNLKDAGIVPCVRNAIHGHRFPAFDGPVMKVSSSFTVD